MADQADELHDPAGLQPPSGRRRFLAVGAAVFALLVGVNAWAGWRDVAARRADELRGQMVAAGRQGALALTTIDHNEFDRDVQRILDASTGAFRDDFAQRAEPFKVLSYQPATAQQSLEAAARDRLTGTFLDDYTQLIKTVVVPDAVGKRITATAKAPAVAVVSADAHHAVVLAYVDQTMAVGSAAPTQTNSAVRVTMDNVEGRWLISGFDPI